ncbi:toxin TumE [Geminocystis sp. CENA526]|uniref:toxin TumE n=1 Tax=Geminocystis sp. CENA526 TaxID=1355871 RepID=UPI003D6F294E
MLPPKILTDYLNQIEEVINHFRNVDIEHYKEEILTTERANIKIRLRFNHKYLLEINEAIIVSENKLKTLDYRYHFQDEHNRLIFRYDSTPHFPNLSTFPHHKHLSNDVISCQKPEITEVLEEVKNIIYS